MEFPLSPEIYIQELDISHVKKSVTFGEIKTLINELAEKIPYKGKISFDQAFYYCPFIPLQLESPKPKKIDYLAITKEICTQ